MSNCLTYPSVSHIQACHIIMPIHLVSHIIMPIIWCLTPPSAYSFSVPCSPSESHNHAYSFGVSCSHIIMPIHRVSHIIMPIHSVSHASHIQASHIIMLIHLVSPVASHNHAYSFGVPHIRVYHVPECLAQPSVPRNHAYLFGAFRLSRIIVPIYSVSHVSICLT